MWEKTKTFKIVYYDNNVMSGDKRLRVMMAEENKD